MSTRKKPPQSKSGRSRQYRHPENQTLLWALHGMKCITVARALLADPEQANRLSPDVVDFLTMCSKEPCLSRTLPTDIRAFLLDFEPEEEAGPQLQLKTDQK